MVWLTRPYCPYCPYCPYWPSLSPRWRSSCAVSANVRSTAACSTAAPSPAAGHGCDHCHCLSEHFLSTLFYWYFPISLSLLCVEKLYQCLQLVQKSNHSLAAHYNSMLLVRSPGRRWLLLSPLLATQEVNFRSYECGQPPLQQAAPSPQPAPAWILISLLSAMFGICTESEYLTSELITPGAPDTRYLLELETNLRELFTITVLVESTNLCFHIQESMKTLCWKGVIPRYVDVKLGHWHKYHNHC